MDESNIATADTSQSLSQDDALALLAELPDPTPAEGAASDRRRRKAAPAEDSQDAAGEDDDATGETDADDFETAPGDDAESDDEAEDGDDEQSESDEELYTVKVDGEEFQVTKEELIAGFQRQSSVTRQSQQLKAEKDQFEQARVQAVKHYDNMLAERHEALNKVTSVLKNLADIRNELETGYDEPDWRALAITLQPHEYNMRQAEWVAAQRDRMGKLQRIQEAEALAMEEAGRQRSARANIAREKLIEALPGLANPEKFASFRAQVKAYAISELKFTQAELERITDARPILAMYKASKYDALVRGQKQPKPKASAPVEGKRPPPTLKPGAAPQTAGRRSSETSRDMKRLRETGDQAAALRLLSVL